MFKLNEATIIKFINSQVNNITNFKDAKDKIKEKYSNMKKQGFDLDKELIFFKSMKRATESYNVENIISSCLSVVAIIIAIIAIILDSIEQINTIIVIALCIYIFISVAYVFLGEYRICNKAKKLVYYDIVIEVIEDLLK